MMGNRRPPCDDPSGPSARSFNIIILYIILLLLYLYIIIFYFLFYSVFYYYIYILYYSCKIKIKSMITQWIIRLLPMRFTNSRSLKDSFIYVLLLFILVLNYNNIIGYYSVSSLTTTTKLYHNHHHNNNKIRRHYDNIHRHSILLSNHHYHPTARANKATLSSLSSLYSKALSISTSLQLSNNDNDKDIIGDDRIRCCIPYILPLLDGDLYGKYIYEHIYIYQLV